jgi:hypothetical protein
MDESTLTQYVILIAIALYIYILVGPSKTEVPKYTPFILETVTSDKFAEFVRESRQYRGEEITVGGGGDYGSDPWDSLGTTESGSESSFGSESGSEFHKNKDEDDFYLKTNILSSKDGERQDAPKVIPIIPSSEYFCLHAWVAFRSELNYKFLWMHDKDTSWMSATAPLDTGLHHKAFEMVPVNRNCTQGQGWVKLRAYDNSGFVAMNGPSTNSDSTWVVQIKSKDEHVADVNKDYHFRLEKDGYILNRGAMAFVNIINNADYPVRGHSSDYWIDRVPAGRESTALIAFQFINQSDVLSAAAHQQEEESESNEEDNKLVKLIAGFPKSNEKRVISFGLYGRNPKYTQGAIRNAELAAKYFPGWECRFYVTSDVPADVFAELTKLEADIKHIPDGLGYVAGMFWRFLVASDPSVDRFLIRDSDSRLNARDAIAVQEWILSHRKVHIERDHVNHCLPMNGGMWGGTKNAIPNMEQLINEWDNRDEYGADLNFLEQIIYPLVEPISFQHDAYCCDRYPASHPYPSKRYANYQHIGQVFDKDNVARLTDIDGFIRGVPVPASCRKHAEWLYG